MTGLLSGFYGAPVVTFGKKNKKTRGHGILMRGHAFASRGHEMINTWPRVNYLLAMRY